MEGYSKMAARNEQFVKECLDQINHAPDAETGVRQLLQHLGEKLACDRVYVFEEMDRQHICNTYEWCKEGIPSGIQQLPYIAKKDLSPWISNLMEGENIIDPDVTRLAESDPLIYGFMKPQAIHSIILSPLMEKGRMVGILGIDNPPKEKMEHISVLFDVLAYFIASLVSKRELQKLRKAHEIKCKPSFDLEGTGKIILLIDDSPELLNLNERILAKQGYRIHKAETLKEARKKLIEIKPDAIILDIDLPDGNGIDFCKELKGSFPVIFLTAHADEKEAKEGLQAGGIAFLTKPYQIEELQNAVKQAIYHNQPMIQPMNIQNEQEEWI